MELSALGIRVARTPGLSTLPQVASQVLKLVDNPNASPRQIGALIERDAGLSSKLLKSANSAYYGAPGKVKTVSQAIAIMGLSAVRSVVVGQAYQQMTSVRGASKRFDRLGFWQHGLATATAGRILAKLKGYADPEVVYLAGLLHDAGRMVMDRFLPNEMDQIVQQSLEQAIPLIEAERTVLGYTHVEVGLLLADHWSLPQAVAEGIGKHHERVNYADCPVGCLVQVANVLAHQAGFAIGAPVLYELDPLVEETLGIATAQLDGIKQIVVQEVMRTQEVLKI